MQPRRHTMTICTDSTSFCYLLMEQASKLVNPRILLLKNKGHPALTFWQLHSTLLTGWSPCACYCHCLLVPRAILSRFPTDARFRGGCWDCQSLSYFLPRKNENPGSTFGYDTFWDGFKVVPSQMWRMNWRDLRINQVSHINTHFNYFLATKKQSSVAY